MQRALALALVLVAALFAPIVMAEDLSRFSGPVGHFEEAADFVNFVFDHQEQEVRLDVDFAEEEFAGSLGEPGETVSFVLWEECEELPEGEAPGNPWCTGTEFSVDPGDMDPAGPAGPEGLDPEASGLTLWAGVYRLRGAFRVEGCDGPHQGLMGCTLTALEAKESAESTAAAEDDGCPCDP